LENKRSQTKSGFFQSERLGSAKPLSELHIQHKSLLTRVHGHDHAVCKEYGKGFTVALKMIDVFHKKQMYDSVIARKENGAKDRNCIVSMLLTS